MIKPLITKTDIKNLRAKDSVTRDELELIMHCDLTESAIQRSCKVAFDNWLLELNFKGNKDVQGEFVQIDNGREYTKKESDRGKDYNKIVFLRKVKKQKEGCVKHFPDVMLLVSNCKNSKLQIFVEFKKIGGVVTKGQEDMKGRLNAMLFDAYLTNNTLFFQKSNT